MPDETTRKSDETAKLNLAAEEAYWREHHAAQSHANKETTYEHFAPAYRVGAEAAAKYPGKPFDEIEDEIALDYEKHQVGSALPWDHVRGASKAAWSRLSGVSSPRDPSRGMRGGI
jgi:hypothetical protein